MNKEEIAPGIVVYSEVIKNHTSLHLDIEEGMKSARMNWGKAYVTSGNEIKVDDNTRNTETININYTDKILEDFSSFSASFNTSISNIFLESFSVIEKDYKAMYGVSTRTHENYSILKYGVGQNFVNHIDDHLDYPRTVSYVYYFNDDYEGGEILFPRFGITYKPKANQCIFFPSNYVYNHSVSPVTSGQRYAVASWMN